MNKYKWHWLCAFITVSLVFGVVYKVVRVSLDSTLHDPLTYEAVGAAWRLANNKPANGQLKADFPVKTDVSSNLNTFTTVYDHEKNLVASSGVLNGQTPELPTGFLDGTNQYVRNYFDWRPTEEVHLAGTTVALGDDGYVLVGRNMQEADRQGNRVTKSVILGWVASVLVLTAGTLMISKRKR